MMATLLSYLVSLAYLATNQDSLFEANDIEKRIESNLHYGTSRFQIHVPKEFFIP